MNKLRILLLPFSLLYAAVVGIRNWLFDVGIRPTTRASVPVIAVGNISAGGTGKTPLVEMIARHFCDREKKVAVISRGYKRSTTGYVVVSNGRQRCAEAAESGDEPSQLAEKLNGVVVVVDENRVRAANRVVSEFGVQLIVLDDAFQHRSLHRDLNICVVPADDLQKKMWLLPGGDGREPFSSLRRADLIVVSRCQDAASFHRAQATLRKWTKAPVAGMRRRSVIFRNASNGTPMELIKSAGKKAVVFSGIGNPASFEEAIRSLSIEVCQLFQFPDHHLFSTAEMESIAAARKRTGADLILTTEKDVARMRGLNESAMEFFVKQPVFFLEIEPDIAWQPEVFQSMLSVYN